MSTPRPEQPHSGDLCGGGSGHKNEMPQGKNKAKGTK